MDFRTFGLVLAMMAASSAFAQSYDMTVHLSAGTLINIQDAAGNSLVTFRPDYSYSSFLFSSADIAQGTTYRVDTGGSCTGTLADRLYTGGTYSGGTLRATISANGGVQTVNF